jgi:hypothetical protein
MRAAAVLSDALREGLPPGRKTKTGKGYPCRQFRHQLRGGSLGQYRSCGKEDSRGVPEYENRRAFTAKTIIKIWAKRGVKIDDVETALDRLHSEGFSR